MTTLIELLFDYARLADAAYVDLHAISWSNPDAVADKVKAGRLPERLADATFTTAPGGWKVLHYDDTENASTGFAAALFERSDGQPVLAMRGTESGLQQSYIGLLKSDLNHLASGQNQARN
jgi:hypothetical protein